LEFKAIYEKLLGHFGDQAILGFTEVSDEVRDPFVTVAPGKIPRVGLFCKVDGDLALDFCQSITALHTGESITCVYHLFSYTHLHTLVVKTQVPRAEATLSSCVKVWPSCNWYEREAFDLFGVTFEGHPDLRRLLLPEDWEGHPGLKDYQERRFYNGIPTTRDNTLDLLDEVQ